VIGRQRQLTLSLALAVGAITVAFVPDEALARPGKDRFSSAYHDCMGRDAAAQGVQPAMNACASEEYGRQDARLNATYRAVMAVHSVKEQAGLRIAQRRWIVARDRKCRAERAEYEGGSMAPLIYYACMADETIGRTAWLKAQG
jgi:uncharacterized protein YecT (DUF1311 family)